jgi:hypothetical protein
VSVSGRLGVQALLVSLVLTGLSHGRGAFRRTRVLTQFLLAFGVVAATHLLWYLATRYLEDAPPAIGRSIEQALLDALYAAVLAPYLFWVLERLRGPLGVTGAAPHERYSPKHPANRAPRFASERRGDPPLSGGAEPRWPRGSPCAKPQTLIKGQPGTRIELAVMFEAGRKHLPVITLRRVA